MKPPYLRRLDRKRRWRFLLVGFLPIFGALLAMLSLAHYAATVR